MTDSASANLSDDEQIQNVISAEISTSDKIRTLANLGLARTEIRDLLGIRYQHVRKVLIDSGIEAGLSNSKRKSPAKRKAVDQIDVALPVFSKSDLLNLGFEHIGRWSVVEDGILLDGIPPNEPGVYAFLLNDRVVYVGLTQNGLKTRMGHYRRGHARQKTSARVKGLISNALSEGGKVEVLTCIPGAVEWSGLLLQLAPSLEASLIGLIQPAWNIQGKRQVS